MQNINLSFLYDFVFLQQFKGRVKSIAVKAVDTTGAGDSFVGGLLTSLASDLNLYQVRELCINGKESLHITSHPS